jgi:hypothetical protein
MFNPFRLRARTPPFQGGNASSNLAKGIVFKENNLIGKIIISKIIFQGSNPRFLVDKKVPI